MQVETINLLFEKFDFKSYLEIGVSEPAYNFNKINAIVKHGVEPHYDGTYAYRMASDEFFEKWAKDLKYDVIFIDGFHEEDQVYKDGRNALRHLNKNGFILFHDCNPLLEEHTVLHKDYKLGIWNGTAYKAFLRKKSSLPNWSCFVVEEPGMAIITYRPILENKIYSGYINNWTDFDNNRKEILQLISFEEYKALINGAT